MLIIDMQFKSFPVSKWQEALLIQIQPRLVNNWQGPVNLTYSLATYTNMYRTKPGIFGGLIYIVSATMQQEKRFFIESVSIMS